MRYPYVQTKRNGKKKLAHRAIMEEHLGLSLGRFEFVHHKNGNKRDNRIENLEVVTPVEHAQHHQQIYPLTKVCVVCGIEFTPHKTKRKRAQACGWDCGRELAARRSREAASLARFLGGR